MRKLLARVASLLAAATVVGALVITVSGHRQEAQACSSFWVNPQTGAEECLDRITTPPSPGPGSSAPSAPSVPSPSPGIPDSPAAAGVDTTVSSLEINQQYAGQRFAMAPMSQMRDRDLIAPSLPEVEAGAAVLRDRAGVAVASGSSSQTPTAYGTSRVPFTGTRVLGGFANPAQADPYRRSGKLFMAFGGNTFNSVCSASMIGRSLLLTAAHCVHEYGRGQAGFARQVRFVPAKTNASEPYRFFDSGQILIPTVYFNGTDTCTTVGVVCNNDIALIALGNNSAGQQAGNLTGFYGYGWNGYSFAIPAAGQFQNAFGNKLSAAITQLGYPGSHDAGQVMQLNSAYGVEVNSGALRNIWLGSAMTGGSSGGPWLVNLGIGATGANYGTAAVRNVVVGVTSWGFTNQDIKVQGSSRFGQNREFPAASYGTRGAGNIGKLVFDACDNPAVTGWLLQSRGRCR